MKSHLKHAFHFVKELTSTLLGIGILFGIFLIWSERGISSSQDIYALGSFLAIGLYLIFSNEEKRQKHLASVLRLLSYVVKKLLQKYLPILLVFLAIYACSPIKNTLKREQELQELKDELIRKGLCKTDSIFLTDTQYIALTQWDTLRVSLAKTPSIDTLIQGVRIRYAEDSFSVRVPLTPPAIIVTKTIKKYDRSAEEVMKKDLQRLEQKLSLSAEEVANYANENSRLSRIATIRLFVNIGLGIIVALIFFFSYRQRN